MVQYEGIRVENQLGFIGVLLQFVFLIYTKEEFS